MSISVWFPVHCKDSIDFLSQWIYWFWWNVRLQRHFLACLGDSGGKGEADLQLKWEAWSAWPGLSMRLWKAQGINKPIAHDVALPIDCTCTYPTFIIHWHVQVDLDDLTFWPSTVLKFQLSPSKSTSLLPSAICRLQSVLSQIIPHWSYLSVPLAPTLKRRLFIFQKVSLSCARIVAIAV